MRKINNYGFTMAELLVVIALIGIMTAVVMINFNSGNYSNDLRQAGTLLLQDIRFAQNYTIGGNSIYYCDGASDDKQGYICPTEGETTGCDGTNSTGTCVNNVPLGGFGINIASRSNYSLFADSVNNQLLDPLERQIIYRNISINGIQIVNYKLGNEPISNPDSESIDIIFQPPEGKIHFYINGVEAVDSGSQPITTLSILVQSDFISDACRLVFINSISGQISESQTGCSL